MKSKPLPSMSANSATLHIKTPDKNGIVSYTEGSQLSKARPGPVLFGKPQGLGSLAEAVEEEKPMAWAEPLAQAMTLYPVTATLNVLSLTLVTKWLKELGHHLTWWWQGLDEQQREMVMGETWGCSTAMSELSDREYWNCLTGNTQQLCKDSVGKEIRMWQVLGWLNLQGKCANCLKPGLQWTH